MLLGSVIVAPQLTRRPIAVGLGAALLTATAVLSGEAPGGQFSAGTELVEVYVSVSDSAGKPITNLPREAFTVREDGGVQTVTTFAAGTMPLALGVALDRSFSMAGRPLSAAKAGARRLLDVLRPGDQTMLVAVGSQVETLVPLSAERQRAREMLSSLTPWGTSPLGDATIAAIARVAEGSGRRALAFFTDGRERFNEAERSAVIDCVRRGSVLVYPIAIGGEPTSLLVDLATTSGGRAFPARDVRDAERSAEALAEDLRYQYLLGYVPGRAIDEGPETWRSIKVTVSRPNAAVRARDGYFAGRRQGSASGRSVASKPQGCHGEGTGDRAAE
jgi:Ca-activated chloride channel homolog